MRLVAADKTGLSFAAPASSVVLDQDRLAKTGELDEAAATMNITTEQLRQLIRQVDVIVSGSGGNITVAPPGALGQRGAGRRQDWPLLAVAHAFESATGYGRTAPG